MRKNGNRELAGLLAAVVLMSFAGCGASKNSVEGAAKDVKLGKYKGVAVTVTGDYTTETALQEMIDSAGAYVKDDSQTVVQADSIVNVDYVGKLNGTPFDGGSATNQNLDVANNCQAGGGSSFIDGFTSGLVGATVGSTVDCPVTFPESYGASELAGKETVFTFTINYICRELSADSLTDEEAQQYFNLDTVDAVKASAKERASESKKSDTRQAVSEAVVQNAKVTVPKELLNARLKEYEDRFQKQYAGDASLESYLKKNYNITKKQFEKQVKSTLKDNLKTELVLTAIAEKEGIKLDKSGFDSYLKDLMKSNNLSSKKDLYTLVGSSEKDGKAYLEEMYVARKACDFCVKSAKVTEK